MLSTGSSENNRLANTKERDFSIGLDNHGFRYFDPEVGRYVSPDPVGFAGGVNWYAYVHNNPINFVDPLGLGPDEEIPTKHVDKEGNPIETFNDYTFDDYINRKHTSREQTVKMNAEGRPIELKLTYDPSVRFSAVGPSDTGVPESWGPIKNMRNKYDYFEVVERGSGAREIAQMAEKAQRMIKDTLGQFMRDTDNKTLAQLQQDPNTRGRFKEDFFHEGIDLEKTRMMAKAMLERIDMVHVHVLPLNEQTSDALGAPPLHPNPLGIAPRKPASDFVLFENTLRAGRRGQDLQRAVMGVFLHELSHTCGSNDNYREEIRKTQFKGIPYAQHWGNVVGGIATMEGDAGEDRRR